MKIHAVKRPLSGSRPCSITRSERKQLLDSHRSFPFHQPSRIERGYHVPHIHVLAYLLLQPTSKSQLPRPLKVPTASHHSNTLIHNGLADPKVAVDPLADAGRLGEGV